MLANLRVTQIYCSKIIKEKKNTEKEDKIDGFATIMLKDLNFTLVQRCVYQVANGLCKQKNTNFTIFTIITVPFIATYKQSKLQNSN